MCLFFPVGLFYFCIYVSICMSLFCIYALNERTLKQKIKPQSKALLTYCSLPVPFLSLTVKHSLFISTGRHCKAINKVL